MNVLDKIKEAKKNKLTKLDLMGIQLTKLPPEIGQLTNLTQLYLHNNRITTLPPEIGQLTNLTQLNLSYNQITTLPPEIGQLMNLTQLNLSYNQITELPLEIGKLLNLNILGLDNNPLQTPPPEIVKKGIKAIRDYLTALEESPSRKLYEAKLILIGQGGVGKTSLAKKLININAEVNNNETSTRGIDICQLTFKYNKTYDFKVNIWDFGGQVIYHSTHQFFLTKRSLYIFVWEVRREEEELQGFYYWLNIIRLLRNNSPVIIVLNKIDERAKELNQAYYKNEFDAIIDFKKVSCNNGTGIDELLKLIQIEIVKLPHVGTYWPETWSKIREQLEKDKRDFIDYAEYLQICQSFGLNETKANHLSDFLHDIGVILHYQDDHILRNIVILKPEWGTNAVYKVLDTKKIQENQGRFYTKDLDSIWGDSRYPREKFPELLQLMTKFELCFRLTDLEDYIIPELLSPQKPQCNWNNENNLRFEYHYKFMPAGIITRFIVRQHRKIKEQYYWKNGVVLQHDNNQAMIESDPLQRKITILIEGFDRKSLLAIIRSELEYIHETLNYPEVKEMIPCICLECKGSNENYRYDYKKLRERLEKNIKEVECENSFQKLAIEQLISGIEEVAAIKEKPNQPNSIDISHSQVQLFVGDISDSKIGFNYQELNEKIESLIQQLIDHNIQGKEPLIGELKDSQTTKDKKKLSETIRKIITAGSGIAQIGKTAVEVWQMIHGK